MVAPGGGGGGGMRTTVCANIICAVSAPKNSAIHLRSDFMGNPSGKTKSATLGRELPKFAGEVLGVLVKEDVFRYFRAVLFRRV